MRTALHRTLLALAASSLACADGERADDASVERDGAVAEPAAAPAPQPPPDPAIEALLARLSVREKAAQLVMVWIPGGLRPGSAELARIEALVAAQQVGGLIVGKGERDATAAALRRLQQRARVPLLVGTDLEWGAGMRLLGATLLPVAMAVAATGDTALAHAHGVATAREARAAGIHVAFAPVLDVNVNPRNPIINTRSFGESAAAVAAFGAATVRGLHDGGLLAVGKHFPGHGDTDQDSHLTLPAIGASRARLDAVELPPFRAAIAAGMDGLMVAHLAVPALTGDQRPASLSPAVASAFVRDSLGFQGLVVTDALNMAGVTRYGGTAQVALLAVRAGADVLLQPPSPEAAISAIAGAVARGELAEARLDASVRRVLQAKARAGLVGEGALPRAAPAGIAALPAARVADTIAARSITLLRDSTGLLPLRPTAPVLSLVYSGVSVPGGAGTAFDEALRARGLRVQRRALSSRSAGAVADSLLRAWSAGGARPPLVLVSSYSQAIPWQGGIGLPSAVAAAAERIARRVPTVHVAFGDPYVVPSVPSAGTVLLAWSGAPAVQRAAARALLGEAAVGGRLPVSLPPRYPLGYGLRRDAVAAR